MNSQLTEDFITCFRELPEEVRQHARRNYQRWRENPQHPSLAFRRVHNTEPIYSVRIGIGWRALGLLDGDTITWFWIGSHAEYDHLLRSNS